ncbi:DUF2878 domain-containing protein [Vibrio sp. SM6]|uniref:DUF2878 domain-containing protein n=1 Tax=Vibrio agarilyticus TaxID=2726741 RepID=A0A7X8YFF8_9VIBR|nr:DUF2878 domain-containing protein [Vibrio agarilyticus]NLS11455.1 DUF2878 domain-containing protein [Vibrio agarilyticus]
MTTRTPLRWTALLVLSLWFQAGWFVAVLGRDAFAPLLWLMVVISLVITRWRYRAPLLPQLIVVSFGLIIDTLNQWLGVLVFSTEWLPNWLVGLWLLFAWYGWQMWPTLGRYSLYVLLPIGAVGGALSYWAGEKLDAVEFGLPLIPTLLVLMSQWLLVMALMVRVYREQKK